MYQIASASYSPLERMAGSYQSNTSYNISAPSRDISYLISQEAPTMQPQSSYGTLNLQRELYADSYQPSKKVTQTYYTSIDEFLNPDRQLTTFIGEAEQIRPFVEETFEKLMDMPFPDDMSGVSVSAKSYRS